jgi:hypothetical protein
VTDPKAETLIKGLTKSELLDQLSKKLISLDAAYTVSKGNDLGWFCGPTAEMVVSAAYNPIAYISMIWDLANYGGTTSGNDGISITLPDYLKNITVKNGKYHGVDLVDVIMTISLRDSENDGPSKGTNLLKYDPSNRAQGTLPWEQPDMMVRMGMEDLKSTYYIGQNKKSLSRLEKAVKQGYIPIIFDDETITNGGRSYKEKVNVTDNMAFNLGIHYVPLVAFTIDKKSKTVTYIVISHGKAHPHTLSYKDFLAGMHGYFIPKKK